MSFDAAALLASLFREAEPAPAGSGPPALASGCRRLALGGLLPCPAPREPAPAGRRAGSTCPRWRRSPPAVALLGGCPWCRGTVFWQSVYGATCCERCEPPSLPALAARWLRVVATEDGPRMMPIGTPPSKE